jgi:hypothetical protein
MKPIVTKPIQLFTKSIPLSIKPIKRLLGLGACTRTATDLRESRFESVFAVFSGEYRYI